MTVIFRLSARAAMLAAAVVLLAANGAARAEMLVALTEIELARKNTDGETPLQ